MLDFIRTDPFDEEPVETERQRLARIDREAMTRFYKTCLHADMPARGKPPRAPYMCHLLRAWKEITEREQLTEERALLSTLSLYMTRNPAAITDMANPVDTPARPA